MVLLAIITSVDYPKWTKTLSVTKVVVGDRRNEAILDCGVVGIDADFDLLQATSDICASFTCCQLRNTSTRLWESCLYLK